MKHEHVKEIIDCMPDDRTLFYYHKDRYAAWLLADYCGDGREIRELKSSRFARLLNKPFIQTLMNNKGDGTLCANDFDYLWQEPSRTFMLTLDTWEREFHDSDQTTRDGFNLVLQLNFSNEHNGYFHTHFHPTMQDDLRSYGHPTLQPGERRFKHETLAWSRIDLDLNTGEALIEEIQNDWLRYAKSWNDCLNCNKTCRWCVNRHYIRSKHDAERVRFYLNTILKPYQALWSEAMLMATLWFLHEELGIHRVYYHTHESGAKLKYIEGRQPPRSLYTQLPRQFCFKPEDEHPEFLQRDKQFRRRLKREKLSDIHWQTLDLENRHAA